MDSLHPFVRLLTEEKVRASIALNLRLFEVARLEEVSHLVGTLIKLAYSDLVPRDFPISPEFRLGLQGIFDWKAVYRLSTEQRIARGLSVWLEGAVTELQEGQVVIFKISVRNLSDQVLNLEVGNTTFGNYFENGAAFVISNAHRDASLAEVEAQMRRAQRQVRFEDVVDGQEEKANHPILTRLEPGETQIYFAKAKLSRKALLDWEGRLYRNKQAKKPGGGHADMVPAYGFLNQRGYDFYLLPAPSTDVKDTLTHYAQVRFIIKRTDPPHVTYWENKELKNPAGSYLPTPTTAASCVKGGPLPAQALWFGDARSNIVPLLVRYDMTTYGKDAKNFYVEVDDEASLYGE